MDVYNPTPQELEKHFLALGHSVELVTTLVEAGEHSVKIDDMVWRNWKHIDLMIKKDFIKNDGRDLSVYEAAVAAGSAFVPNKPE